MTGRAVQFFSKEGKPLYSYTLKNKLPDDLVQKHAYDVISKDRCLGASILGAPFFLFFNVAGFRLLFALSGLLIFCLGAILSYSLFKDRWLSLFFCLVLSLNTFILSINFLNPNLIGLAIYCLILCILFKNTTSYALIGLLFGYLCNIGYENILFFPALFTFLCYKNHNFCKILLNFLAGFTVSIVPILCWNKYAFGQFFIHPSQFSGFLGYRPVFEHHFIFWTFRFNGLLNFPFYETVVRTPHFAFPVFLYLPLLLLKTFGIILTGLFLYGISSLWKHNQKICIFIVLWFIPFYALLSFGENWEDLKTSYILSFFIPMVTFMTCGLRNILDIKHTSAKKLMSYLSINIALLIFVSYCGRLDFPADKRWYQRFPHAQNKTSGLTPKSSFSRNSWLFFHEPEDPGEVKNQKIMLTSFNLFPQLLTALNTVTPFSYIKKEFKLYNIAALDIWRYIYTYDYNTRNL